MPSGGPYGLALSMKFVIIHRSIRIEPGRKTLCAERDCTQSNQEEKLHGVTLALERTRVGRFSAGNINSMLAAFKSGEAL